MTRFDVCGRLSGAVLEAGNHAVTEQGRSAVISGDRVSATWSAAPGDGDAEVRELEGWFESYILAMSMVVGKSSYVLWDGVTRYGPDGSQSTEKSLWLRRGFTRSAPEQLSSYSALAAVIRSDPIVAAAVARLRTAFDLLLRGQEAAAAEAYMVVEGLCRGHRQRDWVRFGRRLEAAGNGKTTADLRWLWASCQLYRHHQTQTDRARAVLRELDRPAGDYARCCWEAAEVVEAYLAGVAQGIPDGD
jgi:hypothetical protein